MQTDAQGAPLGELHAKLAGEFGHGRVAAVIVASTSAASGSASDTTGPLLAAWLRGLGYDCPEPIIVADGEPVADALRGLLTDNASVPRVIITTGGTGVSPDDRTPEMTRPLLEFEIPGIVHALWAKGLESTPAAVLSRGLVGVRDQTLIVNLPGSSGGVRDGMAVLEPLLPHIQGQLEDARGHGPR